MNNEEKYKELFKNLESIEAPRHLRAQIYARIDEKEKNWVKIKVFAFGASSIASLSASLWAVIYFVRSIGETGFGQYISLVFSENGAAWVYWRELIFSLAESLPILGLIFSLTAIGFFIWSATKILANVSKGVRFGLTA